MIGLQSLVRVHSRDHLSNIEQGAHEHKCDEKEDHVHARAPDKRPCHRTDNVPADREYRKTNISQALDPPCSPDISIVVFITANLLTPLKLLLLLFTEKLDSNRHGQTCHHNLHRKQPIVQYESQIASRRHNVLNVVLMSDRTIVPPPRVNEHEAVIEDGAGPEEVETDHLERDENRDLLAGAPPEDVHGWNDCDDDLNTQQAIDHVRAYAAEVRDVLFDFTQVAFT